MDNNLALLLKQYAQKKERAENLAVRRKQDLYKKLPALEKLEEDSSSYALNSILTMLNSAGSAKDKNFSKTLNSNKEKKLKLLKENGYPADYLEPDYECKKCNDTGYITTKTGRELCSCIKQDLYNIAYNSANIYDLQNQNFKAFNLNYYSSESDKTKYGVKLSPRENMEKIYKLALNFVEKFDESDTINLLFCGGTGLGKTFLSSCIANELIHKEKTVLYQTAPIMLDKIIDYKFGKSKENIMSSILSADLLIIDDLGTEAQNQLKNTELFNIINSRILNQNNKITKTIISTNLSLDDLNETYDERIISRIIGNYDCCLFYGDDIRMKKKVGKKK